MRAEIEKAGEITVKSRHTGRRNKPKVVCLDLDFYSALGATKLVKRTLEDPGEPLFLALAFSGCIPNSPSDDR
jgi:hypothetical protein